jgi:hypothetical protein
MAKSNNVDASVYVKMMTDAGIDKEEATESVNKLISFFTENYPDEKPDTMKNFLSIKVIDKIKGAKANKYKVAIVAVGPREDSNQVMRNIALKAFNNDRDAALSNGMIKIGRDGKPIAIDHKKFLDRENTKENKNYGKPYPPKFRREIILLYNGELIKAYGDVDVQAGMMYDVYGGISENTGTMYINSEPSPKMNKKIGEIEFFDEIYAAAKNSSFALSVASSLETDEKGILLVKGTANSVITTQSGSAKIALSDDEGHILSVFSPYGEESYVAPMLEVSQGNDVIVVGRVRDASDPKYGRQMSCIGVVVNPRVTAISKALTDSKNLDY